MRVFKNKISAYDIALLENEKKIKIIKIIFKL